MMPSSARPDIQPVAEDAVLLSFGDSIDPALTPVIAAWCEAIRQRLGERLTDLVPSYASITVHYDPLLSDFRFIINELRSLLNVPLKAKDTTQGRTVELPIWYHPSVAPDLDALARACALTVDQIIEKHTAMAYQVYAVGFSPGFGFMGQVDPVIASPRLEQPRIRVPAGSVGLANRQTAVYPSPSPGGWRLIGRCPTSLFSEKHLSLLSVGDTVRFRAIDHETFLSLGGDDSPFDEASRQ